MLKYIVDLLARFFRSSLVVVLGWGSEGLGKVVFLRLSAYHSFGSSLTG